MCPWAAQMNPAGHMRPARRVFETPAYDYTITVGTNLMKLMYCLEFRTIFLKTQFILLDWIFASIPFSSLLLLWLHLCTNSDNGNSNTRRQSYKQKLVLKSLN